MDDTRAGVEAGLGEAILTALRGAPATVRSVALIGPSGSGKTALARAITSCAGYPQPPMRPGGPESTSLEIISIPWNGTLITVLDTPGAPEFVGDLRAGLRAADAALFIVSSVSGIDAGTATLWEECEAVGMPRALVVTHLDHERADFDETVAVAQRLFSGNVLPAQAPIHDDDGSFAGVIDLLTTTIHDWSTGPHRELAPDPEHISLIDQVRTDLIEGIITGSEDESLLDRFLAGEAIDVDILVRDAETAVARGRLHPVLGWCSEPNPRGTERIMELIVRGLPSPLQHELPAVTGVHGEPTHPLQANPEGPLCAECVQTTSDRHTGRHSVVRVFSGSLHTGAHVHVCGHVDTDRGRTGHEAESRVGTLALRTPTGGFPIDHAPAGLVVSVEGLTTLETGDTLSEPGSPLLMHPWAMPVPHLPIALRGDTTSDADALPAALALLLAEDPTLRLEQSTDGSRLILWTVGEAHARRAIERLRTRAAVRAHAEPVRIALRETLSTPSTGIGQLVQQSEGDRRFDVVELHLDPLPLGSGVTFVNAVDEGAIPHSFIQAIEQGARHQLERGVVSGYPMTDVQITLVDGRSPSVDSSDTAFQSAAALAVRDAASKVAVTLLEPLTRLVISIDDDLVGAVLTDLARRRAHVEAAQSDGSGRTTVTATAPDSELARYAIDLRAISHGTGSLDRASAGFAPMPERRAKALLDHGGQSSSLE